MSQQLEQQPVAPALHMIPQIVAVLKPSSTPITSCFAPNFILDPSFPYMEPDPQCNFNEYFGKRAGICSGSHHDLIIGWSVTNVEALLCYFVSPHLITETLENPIFTNLFNT